MTGAAGSSYAFPYRSGGNDRPVAYAAGARDGHPADFSDAPTDSERWKSARAAP